jgi:hypothetical protein
VALVGFRGLERIRSGRSAYSLRRSRPSVSTARRSSASLRAPRRLATAFRGVVADPPGTPFPGLTRPFRALHQGPHRRRVRAMPPTEVEGRPRNVEPATLLSFLALQRLRNRGSADRGDRCPRHVPTSAFPTPSPAYSPRDLSGISQPVTLLGFDLQGFAPLEGVVTLSGRRSSPAVDPASLGLSTPRRPARLQSLPFENPCRVERGFTRTARP